MVCQRDETSVTLTTSTRQPGKCFSRCYLTSELLLGFTWVMAHTPASGSITGLGPLPLSEMFPALLSFCRRPNATVHDFKIGNSWDLHLHDRLSSVATAERDLVLLAL
ncbi:hypothetical protein HU200_020072 [Digitaria exilis]|uniref:Uncharacterized protein n=1 Tax=Digitaria exilis TaxID=1010633 RepID=A0A835KFC7_9POAL|nr:hypothetical protein HU200_020072 [Digitaria exilis]